METNLEIIAPMSVYQDLQVFLKKYADGWEGAQRCTSSFVKEYMDTIGLNLVPPRMTRSGSPIPLLEEIVNPEGFTMEDFESSYYKWKIKACNSVIEIDGKVYKCRPNGNISIQMGASTYGKPELITKLFFKRAVLTFEGMQIDCSGDFIIKNN